MLQLGLLFGGMVGDHGLTLSLSLFSLFSKSKNATPEQLLHILGKCISAYSYFTSRDKNDLGLVVFSRKMAGVETF